MSDLVVVDTCGWIEVATQGPLADDFLPTLRTLSHVIVPTIVQYELYRWLSRERDEATALRVIGMTGSATVVPLTSAIALLAAEVGAKHRLAMADAVVYATAIHHRATVMTCDQHFADLPDVSYRAKPKSLLK
jgi:predicted nucleic acid-binding protein